MPSYADPVTLRGIVQRKQRTYTTINDVVSVDGVITFLGNVTLNNADKFTLPNGKVTYVHYVSQTLDPKGGGYMTEVYIGSTRPQG